MRRAHAMAHSAVPRNERYCSNPSEPRFIVYAACNAVNGVPGALMVKAHTPDVESGPGYGVRLPVVLGRLYGTVETLRIMCRVNISLCGVALWWR